MKKPVMKEYIKLLESQLFELGWPEWLQRDTKLEAKRNVKNNNNKDN